MIQTTSRCPKCGGMMEEGFLLDVQRNTSKVSRWIAGPPEKSFWTGVKTRGRDHFPVASWRCRSCGFLEMYATEKSE